MVAKQSYLFVSYARQDFDRVGPVVDELRAELDRRAIPVEVWIDISNLRPGESWRESIAHSLESSIGFLFFVSSSSLRSKWVRQELEAAAGTLRLVIPVILERDLDVPHALSERQWIDLSGAMTSEQVHDAAVKIAWSVED
jgi:hypothetical protein